MGYLSRGCGAGWQRRRAQRRSRQKRAQRLSKPRLHTGYSAFAFRESHFPLRVSEQAALISNCVCIGPLLHLPRGSRFWAWFRALRPAHHRSESIGATLEAPLRRQFRCGTRTFRRYTYTQRGTAGKCRSRRLGVMRGCPTVSACTVVRKYSPKRKQECTSLWVMIR